MIIGNFIFGIFTSIISCFGCFNSKSILDLQPKQAIINESNISVYAGKTYCFPFELPLEAFSSDINYNSIRSTSDDPDRNKIIFKTGNNINYYGFATLTNGTLYYTTGTSIEVYGNRLYNFGDYDFSDYYALGWRIITFSTDISNTHDRIFNQVISESSAFLINTDFGTCKITWSESKFTRLFNSLYEKYKNITGVESFTSKLDFGNGSYNERIFNGIQLTFRKEQYNYYLSNEYDYYLLVNYVTPSLELDKEEPKIFEMRLSRNNGGSGGVLFKKLYGENSVCYIQNSRLESQVYLFIYDFSSVIAIGETSEFGGLLELFFGIADTPIYYIFHLFDFELFGMSVFSIFTSLITLLIVVWVVRKLT